ncbi:MAG: NAD-binding protein [Candidatus Marsarchaeota archaeon]|nr:NAD-binding protein [Candidatus Marsarchaeota archaeon]
MRKITSTLIVLALMAVALFTVSFAFLLMAGVPVLDALVWNILSSLDVGFNLFSPLMADNPFIFSASLIDAFVFAITAVVLAAIFSDLIRQFNIRRRFVMSKVRRIKNHVIIVPYNSFTKSINKEIKKLGEKTVIVVDNEDDAAKLYRQGELVIVGSTKSIEVFELAGIGRAKYVIAGSDDDVENALISVTAKSANARAKIVARAKHIDSLPKLTSAGAFRMLMPEMAAGTEIGEEIVKIISA